MRYSGEGVPDDSGSRSSGRSAPPARSRRAFAIAVRTAPSSASSSNGLVMKSTAPAFIACTAIGMSPWPVMRLRGIGVQEPKAGPGIGQDPGERLIQLVGE